MSNGTYESFREYYKFLADRLVEWDERGRYELIGYLDDGTVISYNSQDNVIRNLPSDKFNLTEEECKREFGRRLRDIMYDKGVTQEELSIRTGIPQPMLSGYLTGRCNPSFYKVDKIAKALDCSVDDFRYI